MNIDLDKLTEQQLEELIEDVGSMLFHKRNNTQQKESSCKLTELSHDDFTETTDYTIDGEEVTVPDASVRNFLVVIGRVNEIIKKLNNI